MAKEIFDGSAAPPFLKRNYQQKFTDTLKVQYKQKNTYRYSTFTFNAVKARQHVKKNVLHKDRRGFEPRILCKT